MATLSSGEAKTQSFLKSKVRAARILLTNVTRAELLAKEATSSKPWPPQDTGTLHGISEATFDIDDFYRVVDVLHGRFEKFNEKQWKKGYKALILLEYLLTHGPLSFADELASDKEVMQKMCNFHCYDEMGHNWGPTMKKKAERVLRLMEKGPFLKEERDRLRQTTRRIQGFGNSSSDRPFPGRAEEGLRSEAPKRGLGMVALSTCDSGKNVLRPPELLPSIWEC